MTVLDLPCIHHEPSQTINNVVLRSYLKAISPPSLTTFPLSPLNEPQWYFVADAFEWQLDRMFGIWNSAICEISNWIQKASTYRSTVVLNRIYKAFFHSKDFLDRVHRPDQILLAILMLALEIEFERALYLYDEGYETSDNYCLPQLLNKSTWFYISVWSFLQPHRLPETNDTCFSTDPKMKTSKVPTTLSSLQMAIL